MANTKDKLRQGKFQQTDVAFIVDYIHLRAILFSEEERTEYIKQIIGLLEYGDEKEEGN